MTKIVLFLGDFISIDSVKATESRFLNAKNNVCFYRKDNSKLEDPSNQPKFNTLFSDRHFDYLAWVFEQIQSVYYRTKSVWLKNLINIARYEIYEKHTEKLYAFWAIETLRRKYPFSNILVIEKDGIPDARFQKAAQGDQDFYLQLPQTKSPRNVGMQYFLKKLAKAILSAENLTRSTSQPEVLFIESYANSAKISFSLQKALSVKHIRAEILALNDKVCKARHDDGHTIRLEKSVPKIAHAFFSLIELLVFCTARIFLWQQKTSSPIFKQLIDDDLYHSLARAAWYRLIFSRILQSHHPKMVLSTSLASLPVRAMMLNCNEKGIETGFVQHGLHAPSSLGINKEWMVQKHIFLWGRHERQIFTNVGFELGSLHMIGSNKINIHLEKGKNVNLKRENERNILYLPQRTGGAAVTTIEGQEMLEWFASACYMLSNVTGKVKFHTADRHTDIASGYAGLEVISPLVPIATLLQNADIVVAGFSTTAGLEACALGRPLIILVTENRKPVIDYAQYGAALIARNKEELVEKVEAISQNEVLRQSLKEGCERLFEDYFEFIGEESTASFVQKVKMILYEEKIA